MVRRSNCFVFAWYCYWFRGYRYCALRPSEHIAGWHWLVSRDLRRWIHYEPLRPRGLPFAIWHKVWYRGRITRGD